MSNLSSATVAAWDAALRARAASIGPFGAYVGATIDLSLALSSHADKLRAMRDAANNLGITHGLWSSYMFSLLQALQTDFGMSLTPGQSPANPTGTLSAMSQKLWQTYVTEDAALTPLVNTFTLAYQAYVSWFAALLAAFNAYVASIPAWQDCDFSSDQAMADLLVSVAADCNFPPPH